MTKSILEYCSVLISKQTLLAFIILMIISAGNAFSQEVIENASNLSQDSARFKYTPIPGRKDSCECPCEPDFEIVKRMEFEIKRKGGSYRLYSKVSENTIFLSKRSTLEDVHGVIEPFYVKQRKLKVEYNGKKLDRSRFHTFYEQMRDAFFSENKVHGFKLPGNIQIGDSIQISYENDYEDIAYFPIINIPNKDYIYDFIILIIHPKDVVITPEIFFPRDKLDYAHYQPEENQTVIRFKDVCKVKELPYFLYNDIRASILITASKNGIPLTPTTPASYIDWYSKLTPLSPVLEEVSVHEQIFGIEEQSTDQTVKEAYDYIRENIRYISDVRGDHAIVPYEPFRVLKTKYGDCKDRASLLSALGAQRNIRLPMVLVSTDADQPFNGVHGSLFNHVISAHIEGNDTLFLDPTSRYSTIENLPDYLIDRFVVILDSANSSTTKIRAKTDRPSVAVKITGDLNGLDTAKAIVTFKNGWQGRVQRAVYEQSEFKLQFFLDSLITQNMYKLSFNDFKLIDSSSTGVTFETSADLNEFIIKSGEKYYIPKIPFVTVDRELMNRRDDTYPVHFDNIDRLKLSIKLTGQNLSASPDEIKIGQSGLAHFNARFEIDSSAALVLDYEYDRSRKSYSGADKTELLEFCQNFLDMKAEVFVLGE